MREAFVGSLAVVCLGVGTLLGQAPPPPPPAPPAPQAPVTGVAATVNGQPITEASVQRGLRRVPPDRQAGLRGQLISFLVDNMLIEQYLVSQKVVVDPKQIEVKLADIKGEIKKEGSSLDKVMADLMLTEKDIREQINAELRWEKFVEQQTTDAKLKEVFEKNREVFDGTMVRARHILLAADPKNPKVAEDNKLKLATLKKEYVARVTQELGKVPAVADKAELARAQQKVRESAFAELAAKHSACPSKAQGGELGYFPRAGAMVEPFAATAFGLQPGMVSDVVTTQFGQHLILVTDRKQGKPIKFEDAKEDVKEYVGEDLRGKLLDRLRPSAKVVVK